MRFHLCVCVSVCLSICVSEVPAVWDTRGSDLCRIATGVAALVDTLRAHPDRVDALNAACEALVYLLDDEPRNVQVRSEGKQR